MKQIIVILHPIMNIDNYQVIFLYSNLVCIVICSALVCIQLLLKFISNVLNFSQGSFQQYFSYIRDM